MTQQIFNLFRLPGFKSSTGICVLDEDGEKVGAFYNVKSNIIHFPHNILAYMLSRQSCEERSQPVASFLCQ